MGVYIHIWFEYKELGTSTSRGYEKYSQRARSYRLYCYITNMSEAILVELWHGGAINWVFVICRTNITRRVTAVAVVEGMYVVY